MLPEHTVRMVKLMRDRPAGARESRFLIEDRVEVVGDPVGVGAVAVAVGSLGRAAS